MLRTRVQTLKVKAQEHFYLFPIFMKLKTNRRPLAEYLFTTNLFVCFCKINTKSEFGQTKFSNWTLELALYINTSSKSFFFLILGPQNIHLKLKLPY